MIDTTYYGGHDNLDAKKETNNLGEEKIEKIDEDYEHLASTIKDDWRDVYIWIFLEVPKRSEIYTTKCLYNLPIIDKHVYNIYDLYYIVKFNIIGLTHLHFFIFFSWN